MSYLQLPVPLFALSILFMMNTSAQAKEEESPSADFLDFLMEVEDATGDAFETWLETTLDEDSENN